MHVDVHPHFQVRYRDLSEVVMAMSEAEEEGDEEELRRWQHVDHRLRKEAAEAEALIARLIFQYDPRLPDPPNPEAAKTMLRGGLSASSHALAPEIPSHILKRAEEVDAVAKAWREGEVERNVCLL